jgi:putative inorganic carbon (hco3(-)) transporter
MLMSVFLSGLIGPTFGLQRWRDGSQLNRLIGLFPLWRQGTTFLADGIGALLASLLYAIAPFVPNAGNSGLGLLLIALALYWLLLTLSDDEAGSVDPVSEKGWNLPNLTTPLHLTVACYWAIAAVATGLSPVRKLAFEGLTKLSLYMLLFALLARVLRSPRLRNWVIAVYLNVALAVSTYGITQLFAGAKQLATWVDPASPSADGVRVYSYLGNPNLLAGYLLPAICLSAMAMLVWKGRLRQVLAGVMLVCNVICMALTGSRGGWIGTVVAGFVLLLLLLIWWQEKFPQKLRAIAGPAVLMFAGGTLMLVVLAVPALRNRVLTMFLGSGDSSNSFRINVWKAVIKMIQARPVLGIGPGNDAFNAVYPLYQQARYTALSAYSILLEVLVETGLIGLVAFLWMLGTSVQMGWQRLNQLRLQAAQGVKDPQVFWLVAAIASFFGMLGHGIVDTVWYRPQVNTLWWLMLALIASYYSRPRRAVD